MVKIKVIFVGDSGVGKTCIANKICNKDYNNVNTRSTVGGVQLKKTYSTENTNIETEFWDTAGSEAYKSLGPMYYRGAEICILVFSFDKPQSFKNIEEWRENVIESTNIKKFIVIGNKYDLFENNPNEFDHQNLKFDHSYIETSYKTGYNMMELDQIISTCVAECYTGLPKKDETISLDISEEKKSIFKFCLI